jgi:myo-inositol-1(or 4)-monophosphatase
MRYSANLNIIIKAIEKAAGRLPRDFMELENLQSNTSSATKFANACYNKTKQILAEDLLKLRPEYNIIFSDGQQIINKKDAEYCYTVFPIDGLANLSRSDPHFTVAVALEHIDASGKKESISVAVSNIVGNEVFYCEKGFGSYASSRRIRVSKRSGSENFSAVLEDLEFSKSEKAKNLSARNYGCKTLEIAYLASARVDALILKNSKDNELLKPFMLLVREAGGKVLENDGLILASNGSINLV